MAALLRADSWNIPLQNSLGGLPYLQVLRQDAPSSLFISPTSSGVREDVFRDAPRSGSYSATNTVTTDIMAADGLSSPMGKALRQQSGLPMLSLPGVSLDDPFSSPTTLGPGILDALRRPDSPARPDSPGMRAATGRMGGLGVPSEPPSPTLSSPFAKSDFTDSPRRVAAVVDEVLRAADGETDSGDSGHESYQSHGQPLMSQGEVSSAGNGADASRAQPAVRAMPPLPPFGLVQKPPVPAAKPRSMSRSLSRLGQIPSSSAVAQPGASVSIKRSAATVAWPPEEEQALKAPRLSPFATAFQLLSGSEIPPLPDMTAAPGYVAGPEAPQERIGPEASSDGPSPAAVSKGPRGPRQRRISQPSKAPKKSPTPAPSSDEDSPRHRRGPSKMGRKCLRRHFCVSCSKKDEELKSQWRKGPGDVVNLCNACGVRWKKGKFPPDRKQEVLDKWESVKHLWGY